MIKAEINKPEYRKTIEKTNKLINWFFENIKNSLIASMEIEFLI